MLNYLENIFRWNEKKDYVEIFSFLEVKNQLEHFQMNFHWKIISSNLSKHLS